MKVGLVGPAQPDSFADNIRQGLEDLGYETAMLGSPRGEFVWRPFAKQTIDMVLDRFVGLDVRVQRRMLGQQVEGRLDLVIVVDRRVDPQVVTWLRGRADRVVFWFPDAVLNMGRMKMIMSDYDALFFKEPALVRLLGDQLRLPVHYLPQGCSPRWHRIHDDVGQPEPFVAVVGNLYPYRMQVLRELERARVPLRLYGSPFPRWADSADLAHLHTGEYVTRDRKARVMRGAAAVLNSIHPSEYEGVNSRLFEATACGATVLSEERPDLHRFFVSGEEVLSYSHIDELIDHARWALDNPDASRKVGDAAAARSHRDHTYEQRLPALFESIGLSTRSSG